MLQHSPGLSSSSKPAALSRQAPQKSADRLHSLSRKPRDVLQSRYMQSGSWRKLQTIQTANDGGRPQKKRPPTTPRQGPQCFFLQFLCGSTHAILAACQCCWSCPPCILIHVSQSDRQEREREREKKKQLDHSWPESVTSQARLAQRKLPATSFMMRTPCVKLLKHDANSLQLARTTMLWASFSAQTGLCKLLCASCSVQVAAQVAPCKLPRASCPAQVAPCKLLCASCSVQVALCKLLCASCFVQVALCKKLCATWQLTLCKCLCTSCSAQAVLCKLLCASCSAQVALSKLLCASCSAQVCKILFARCCTSCSAQLLCTSYSAQVA